MFRLLTLVAIAGASVQSSERAPVLASDACARACDLDPDQWWGSFYIERVPPLTDSTTWYLSEDDTHKNCDIWVADDRNKRCKKVGLDISFVEMSVDDFEELGNDPCAGKRGGGPGGLRGARRLEDEVYMWSVDDPSVIEEFGDRRCGRPQNMDDEVCWDNPQWNRAGMVYPDGNCDYIARDPANRCHMENQAGIRARDGCECACVVTDAPTTEDEREEEEVEPSPSPSPSLSPPPPTLPNPSPAPSFKPTLFPVASTDCADDPDWVKVGNPDDADCAWIAQGNEDQCDRAEDASGVSARDACGCGCKVDTDDDEVDACADDDDWYYKKAKKDCEWVAAKSEKRCKKKGSGKLKAKVACCASCAE